MLKLYGSKKNHLEELMKKSPAPSLDELRGFEFDGLNTPWYTALLGIKKFRKGFYEGHPRAQGPEPFLQGYNIPVKQNGLEESWIPKPSEEKPKYFGFFRVYHRPDDRGKYAQALLLDYGLGANPFYAPEKFLRDYLVKPEPDNPDILLGKAYIWGLPVSYFILRRAKKENYTTDITKV